MEEEYEIANARAWDSSLKNDASLAPDADESGWQTVNRQKKLPLPTPQPSQVAPQNRTVNHRQGRRPPQTKNEQSVLRDKAQTDLRVVSRPSQHPPPSRPDPSCPANTTPLPQDHDRTPATRKAATLASQEDNTAKQAWRNQELPVDRIRISASIDIAVHIDSLNTIATELGTYLCTIGGKVKHGHGSWTFGIWGGPPAVATTKASLLSYLEENDPSRKHTGARKFAKTASLTPALRNIYQTRWKREVKTHRYRQMPPVGMGFDVIGNFHWPMSEYRPEEVLGQALEALDPIRMTHSCYVVRENNGRPVLQVMGTDRDVRSALQALKKMCFQVAARSIDPVRLYLLRWPSGPRGSHVFLEDYQGPALVHSSEGTNEMISKSPRAEGFSTSVTDIEAGRLSTYIAIERARSCIQSALRQIPCLQGRLQMRARLGVFVLTRYLPLTENDMYELAEYEAMIKQTQFMGVTTQEIGDPHREHELLATMQNAKILLKTLDSQQHDLSEVLPGLSADFIFADEAGDLHLSVTWCVNCGTSPSKPELQEPQVQWTRREVGSGEPTRLLDLNLVDLSNGFSWSFELSTEKPVSADKLPSNLVLFAQKVSVSQDAIRNDGPLRPFVAYSHIPALRWMRESRDYKYRLADSDYTLELSRFQIKDIQIKDKPPSKAHRTFEPRWSLSVHSAAWATNFAHNQNLKVGESAPWSADLEEWFRREPGGPDTEDDGFGQFITKLERVEALVRCLPEEEV